MQYPFLFLLIIGLSLVQMTDACGKRPAKTTPTPTTTLSPNSTHPTLLPSYRLPCNGTESKMTGCLHGGTCFVVIIKKDRKRNCQCPKSRIGHRCQQLAPDFFAPFVDPNKLRTAHIAAGAVGTVIIVLVIVSSVYIYLRVKKKERGLAHRHRQNGGSTHANATNNQEDGGLELETISLNQTDGSTTKEYV